MATAIRQVSALDATLKWPNDVLLRSGKLAGILAEQSGDAVVVGIGVNVSTARHELPAPAASSLPATSLRLEGSSSLDRELLLGRMLDEIERWYLAWRGTDLAGDAEASGLRPAYVRLCSTIGRDVRAELPGRAATSGLATGVDGDGRLVVRTAAGDVAIGAGVESMSRVPIGSTTDPGRCRATMRHMVHDASSGGPERSVLVLHPHWKVLLWPVIFGVLVVAAVVAVLASIPAGASAGTERLVIAAVAVVLLLVGVLRPVLRWKTTTWRLRVREGIVTRRGRDIPLARITDVSFTRSLLDRLLGAGRLIVESPGEHGQIVLADIPSVERVQAILFELVGQEQARLAGEDR